VLVGRGVDNHGGPALSMDSRGHLYIAFGPHNGPFQLRRSKRPFDISEWETLPEFGDHATYPSLVCGPDDTLHCTYRGGPMPRRLMYQRRPPGGDWTPPRELVNPAVANGYTQYGNALAVGQDGILHLAFHIYHHHPPGGKAVGYLRSEDGGDTWRTAEGERIELPASPSTRCFIERGRELDMRVGNIAVDARGRPWLPVFHFEAKPRTVTLWTHDGVGWRARPVLPEIRSHFPDKELAWQGTLTFDREGRLYLATVVQTPPGGWGHPSQEVVLLISDDGARTFRVFSISATDPELPNWLPSVERPFGPRPIGAPALVYTHGGPGVGCTEGDPTEVVFVQLMPK